jgi:hypothetical protein
MPSRLVVLGLIAPLLLGCGAATVPEDGVESKTRDLLAEMNEDVGDVDCPDDLEAEVGATMECSAIIGGMERGVTVEVTEVEDDKAQWKVDVQE